MAVAVGVRTVVRRSQAVPGVPVVLGPDLGCALLPQGLLLADLAAGTAVLQVSAGGGSGALLYRQHGSAPAPTHPVELVLDGGSGLPLRASWTVRRDGVADERVAIAYADYQSGDGFEYPATVTVAVDGAQQLVIRYSEVRRRTDFAESDFPLPPPRQAPGARVGGGR